MTVCEKNDIIFKKLTLSILCAGKLKKQRFTNERIYHGNSVLLLFWLYTVDSH